MKRWLLAGAMLTMAAGSARAWSELSSDTPARIDTYIPMWEESGGGEDIDTFPGGMILIIR